MPHIQSVALEHKEAVIVMDVITRHNLEIAHNFSGSSENTLIYIIDHTIPPNG